MKANNILEKLQRKTDKFVISAREASSRGTSFLIAMLGVILQAAHTTLLMYDISGFDSVIIRFLVSFGLGVFISCALAIFTIKHDGKDRSIGRIINIFFYFEIFTNIFYYFNSLIFSKVTTNFGFENVDSKNWLYLIVAMPFSFIVPFAIKQFAGVIKADEKLSFGQIETEEDISSVDKSELEKIKLDLDSFGSQAKEISDLKKKLNDVDPKKYFKKGESAEIEIGGKKAVVTFK